jgi:hypothetical protein
MPIGGDIRVSEGALQQVDLGAPVHGVARVGVPEPLRRDLRGILETPYLFGLQCSSMYCE